MAQDPRVKDINIRGISVSEIRDLLGTLVQEGEDRRDSVENLNEKLDRVEAILVVLLEMDRRRADKNNYYEDL